MKPRAEATRGSLGDFTAVAEVAYDRHAILLMLQRRQAELAERFGPLGEPDSGGGGLLCHAHIAPAKAQLSWGFAGTI